MGTYWISLHPLSSLVFKTLKIFYETSLFCNISRHGKTCGILRLSISRERVIPDFTGSLVDKIEMEVPKVLNPLMLVAKLAQSYEN